MADKETKLSIVLRTVDNATAGIRAINARLDAITKPTRDFKKALNELKEKSGLNDVIAGFRGVGSAIAGVLAKVGLIGGIVGVGIHGLFKLVDEFDDLGDKAERFGVGVDFLAQMRFAAEKAGAPIESLDSGLQAFSQSLGQARAGTGRMLSFLNKVSPALARQVKGAKSNEEAFDLMANAMAKIQDPAKRAALAQKVFEDSALAPLLAKGAKGIAELRAEHFKNAGSMKEAAEKAGAVDDAMKDLKASTDGVKAALIVGLAPALKIIVRQLAEWFTAHRADIAEWAKQIGERLPGAIKSVVEWLGKAWDKMTAFIDKIGGVKNLLIAVAAISLAPLASSILGLVSGIGKLATAAGLVTPAIALWAGPLIAATALIVGLNDLMDKMNTKNEVALEDAANAKRAESWLANTFGIDRSLIHKKTKLSSDVLDLRALMDEKIGSRKPAADVGTAGLAALLQARDDVSGQSRRALTQTATTEARVTVDFANAPRGTRVKTDPKSTADVDLSVGYQMLATP